MKKSNRATIHGPIQEAQRANMNALAQAIDKMFNPDLDNKKVSFVLLTALTGDIKEGRVNYISNGHREDMVAMLHELLARFEGRYVADEHEVKQ